MGDQDALLKALNILARLDELGLLDAINEALTDEGLQRLASAGVGLMEVIAKLLDAAKEVDWSALIAIASSIDERKANALLRLLDAVGQVDMERLRLAASLMRSDVGSVSLARLLSAINDEETRRVIYKLLLAVRILAE
ncbi:hypothetical protein GCM10007981_02690 [Thermocladium modestius]|uniref:DUF1641 domain-containing protein n=1 Tax=Thermocladium modestius TaxID=62609 RepID=A0A830GTU6_9CREN|nr:hypothetical protein [Thermocladium modestius]GGP19352.1 hypothetical protein GCM10007981_02690 [Thermocladium modestius]